MAGLGSWKTSMTIVLNSTLFSFGSLSLPPDHKEYSLTGCSICDAPE